MRREIWETEGAGRPLPPTVRARALEQEGVIARAQLVAAGMTPDAVRHARRSGRLHRLHRGVYAIAPPELLDEDAWVVAALLAVGPHASLARGTAAWGHRLIPRRRGRSSSSRR